MGLSEAKPKFIRERFIYLAKPQGGMSEDRKRLQEINATIEMAVEHLNELYLEKKKLEEKLFD